MAYFPPGTVTYATLPHPGRMQTGDFYLTKDVGEVWSDGSYWQVVAGTVPVGFFANLPALGTLTNVASGTVLPAGVMAYTTDVGFVIWGGAAWAAAGGGGSTIPTIYSATVVASVNNYAPTGFGPTTIGKLTPASGGSTITGLSSTGWTAGQSSVLLNQSTTDSFTFPHQSGSSSAGNQFNNANGSPATLAPGAGAIYLWDGTYFRFY